jgi:hypothetical protein
MIPADASFTSSKALLPYFAERNMISFITFKHSPFSFPYGTEYLLYDINSPQMTPPLKKAVKFLLSPHGNMPGYEKIFSDSNVLLLKKDDSSPDFFEWVDEKEMGNIKGPQWEKPKPVQRLEDQKKEIKVGEVVHTVWVEYVGQNEIFYQRKDLGTNQVSPSLRLTASGMNSHSPQITSDNSGGIHIVWTETKEKSFIHYKYIDDMWGPWSINERISKGLTPEFLHHNDDIYLDFKIPYEGKRMVRIKNYW